MSRFHSTQKSTAWALWRLTWALTMACIVFVLCLVAQPLHGQSTSGTISGTVTDSTGAVIPMATVTLQNAASGDKRTTATNNDGFFSFQAVPPTNYKVIITSKGFVTWVGTDIALHANEKLGLSSIVMKVATTDAAVEVSASQAGVIQTDSPESSTTINSVLVESLSIQGRNAAELVKFMPGMGMNTGFGQTQFNSQTTQTNSGPIGQYSANGTQPYGSMQMTMDGAGLIDVGNQGTQIANVNQDATAEFTYLNAAFGADTPRGPNIIQVTSKAGGNAFHGSAYAYLRNWQMNANDALYKAQSYPDNIRPMDHQTYLGGTFGGPVLIPGTSFNRNRDKLFFFANYENMLQNPFPTIHYGVTPTTAMINGDFSTASMPGAQNSGSTWWPSAQVPCANAPNWTGFCPSGSTAGNPGSTGGYQNMFANGKIPSQYWDPNGRALLQYLNKVDAPNIDPASNNGYNFKFLDATPVNRWELRLRGDYAPTVNDKISVIYTKQNEADINNFGIWWWPGPTLPMASQLNATTKAKLWVANYVHVFNATTTNEAHFAYTYFTFPPTFSNPSAMSASAAGYTSYAPFNTSSTNSFDQLPNLISWGSGIGNNNGSFPGLYAPPMIKAFGNAYGNVKKIWAFENNFSKVIGRHTLKAGFFWDENFQTQTTGYGNWTQGGLEFDNWGYYTTNNPIADILVGHATNMSQYSSAPVHDVAYHEYAIYGQDRWQATRRLTLNYGLRLEHEGNWYPTSGPGFAVWDPSKYDDTANAKPWTGAVWHQIDSSVPQSGFVSKMFNPDLRGGFAYDVHGNGETVVRAGAGIYRWQFSEGDVDSALNPGLNVLSITTPGTMKLSDLATFGPSSGKWCATDSTCPSGIDLIKKGEDKSPFTINWNVALDQVMPGHMVFELQYIANHTDNALLTGNGSNANFIANINKIPVGGFYKADKWGNNPWAKSCASGSCAAPGSAAYNGYRPYSNYGVLNEVKHGSYSNYNGLVAALQKQSGRQTFLANYTFSKVLGIRDGQTNNGAGDGQSVDPYVIRNNYGPLAYDHSHIFNVAYYVNLPGLKEGNAFVKTVANGWQLSGTMQAQSGAPIQPNSQGTLNLQYNADSLGGPYGGGTNGAINSAYMFGTDSYPNVMPNLVCDPRNGGHGKYFNTTCFQAPTPKPNATNGPTIWPYIKAPAYFNTDIAAFKDFHVTERQHIQFRASAFNFLNHPLPEFNNASDVNLQMSSVTGQNINSTTTGNPAYKRGRRVMELTLKYNF
jgi:hypothetical protein